MQVTETLNEGLKRGYSIVLPAAELDARVTEKLEEARKTFQMKGFRKGKAPVALMRKMFGKSVLGEAMQEQIDAAMKSHFDETGDRPALQPDVKMTNEDWQEGQDVEVALTYEALPEVPEVPFGDIALERMVVSIDEAAVTEALENLAASAKDYTEKDAGAAAEDGDQVTLDFVGRIGGEAFDGGSAEDFPLVLGSGSFIPGFEPQLEGTKAGETKDITVTFPEDYGNAALAGAEAVFSCTIKAVKGPVPAPIDDTLAARFGVETLDALKTQISDRLAAEYASAARTVTKRALMDKLDEVVAFDVPPTLVETEAKQIAHQLWHEENPEVEDHNHPEIEPTDEHTKLAERRVRLGLLLADLGSKNEVSVTDAEMQQAMIAQARQYPGQERQFLEFLQKNEGARQQIRAPLFEDKVVDFIFELAKIDEKSVTRDELQAAVDALDAAETGAAPAATDSAEAS